MNELISITGNDVQFPVDCRMLHGQLEVGTEYRHWFPRQTEGVFVEGEDFNTVKNERVQIEGSREVSRDVVTHHCTIGMAKELCMLQRNEKGRQVRRYLIEIEEQWNQPDMVIARALQMSAVKIETLSGQVKLLEAKVEQDKPLVAFGKAIENSTSSILVREFAKLASNNPKITIGQNRLYEWLREKKYLMWNNEPYQTYVDSGWFETKEIIVNTSRGSVPKKTTLVTGKGQIALMKALCKYFGAESVAQ